MDEQIVNRVIEIVRENTTSLDPEFCDTKAELSQIGIDSIIFIRIVVAIEGAFDIEISDEKLLITEMGTIEKMVEVVSSAIEEKNS